MSERRKLRRNHRVELQESGISERFIESAGVYSIENDAELKGVLRHEFLPKGLHAPAICFPTSLFGEYQHHNVVKPDKPRMRDGKPIKYESPLGCPVRAYYAPGIMPGDLLDASRTILVTEGQKKALAAATFRLGAIPISISGVWNWQTKRENDADGRPIGDRKLIDDLALINWYEREVLILFDSDAATNSKVMLAESELCRALQRRGARVLPVRLPQAEDGSKLGLDDYLVTHGKPAFLDLVAAARERRTTIPTATVKSAAEMMGKLRWHWPGYVIKGGLNALCSREGCGKTRFVADVLRRIHNGLPWPDGTTMTLTPDTKVLWVAADGHHAEIAGLCDEMSINAELVLYNAPPDAPETGTLLDNLDAVAELRTRIEAHNITLVIIDTVSAATYSDVCTAKDVARFTAPLKEIAAATGVTFLLLCHLNKEGDLLGRRLEGQCRVVVKLEAGDGDNERTLSVAKSFAKKPADLKVIMGDAGNEYEQSAGTMPRASNGRVPTKLIEAANWLQETLAQGPKEVYKLRNTAKELDISTNRLYAAKDRLRLEESTGQDGKKLWELPSANGVHDGTERCPF